MDSRISTPVFDVILDAGEGEISEHRVQVWNVDIVRYDRTAAKHGWPRADAAPMLWNTFIVWSAMRRLAIIGTEMPFDDFEAKAIQIQLVNRDQLNGSAADGIDPTLAVVGRD
jgi:hypothetical protein